MKREDSQIRRFKNCWLKMYWTLTSQLPCMRTSSCWLITSSRNLESTIDKQNSIKKTKFSGLISSKHRLKNSLSLMTIFKTQVKQYFLVHQVTLSKTKLESCSCLWLERSLRSQSFNRTKFCRLTSRRLRLMISLIDWLQLTISITLWVAIESYSRGSRLRRFNQTQTLPPRCKVLRMRMRIWWVARATSTIILRTWP